MQITLIRHLPTEWNKIHKLQGRRDIEISPITEEDKIKIAVNRETLRKLEPFEFVLASSLRRTHQTAKLYGYEPETESLLDELDFGPFEGLEMSKLIEKFGDQWFENPLSLEFGETVSNLERRIKLFLQKYKAGNNLLVFGHGTWIRALRSYFQYGHINHMNKLSVKNNECITLFWRDKKYF